MRYFLILGLLLLSFKAYPQKNTEQSSNLLNYLQEASISEGENLFRANAAVVISSGVVYANYIVDSNVRSQSLVAMNQSEDQETPQNDVADDHNDKIFEVAAVIILVLFFAVVGFFVIRYFRKSK
jgi:hypothetical protein